MRAFEHITHGAVKLGLSRRPHLFKMVPLSNYLKPKAVAYPEKVAWERPIDWGMLGNDTVGDCVIAWMMHHVMALRSVANAGSPLTFSTEQAIETYSAITGYVPGDESTDNGTDPQAAAQYWQQTGIYGHKIDGFVSVDVSNLDAIKAAHYLFGGLGLSIQVPDYVMSVPAGGSWSYAGTGSTQLVGGHQIYGAGYGADGMDIVSWGTRYTFNYAFLSQNCEMILAVVSQDWIKQSGISPSGLDLDALLADLKTS